MGLLLFGRKAFYLCGVKDGKRIEQHHVLHIGCLLPLFPLRGNVLELFIREVFPWAVFSDDEGNFFGPQKFHAFGPLFHFDILFRVRGLNLLQLLECYPPVVLVALDDAGQYEFD